MIHLEEMKDLSDVDVSFNKYSLPSVLLVKFPCFSSSACFNTSKIQCIPFVYTCLFQVHRSYSHKTVVFPVVIFLLQLVLVKECYYFHHNQAKDEVPIRDVIQKKDMCRIPLLFLLREIVCRIQDYKFPLEMNMDFL